MKVCVLGAGVIGLTTAFALAEAGCDVTIVDAAAQPAQGASAANGAQLSYNYVAPLASPDLIGHLPSMLLDRHGPLRVAPGLDADFVRWGVAFLRACRSAAVRETTAAQLLLAGLSRAEIERISTTETLDFGRRMAGKLIMYRDPGNFAGARRQAERQAAIGEAQQLLSGPECLAKEPGLRIAASRVAGGVYTASEEVGDCAAFCHGLAERLRRRNNVAWLMEAEAHPVMRGGALAAVRAGSREIAAEQFVLSLGAASSAFAREAGFRLPVYPVKGYSLTLRPRTRAASLSHSVTDADRKIVFAPLDSAGRDSAMIRVAGAADFVGHDSSLDPRRVAMIRAAARETLDIDDADDPLAWTGLRPMTPDSRPIVGPSPLRRLFLNTGHGGLGWTLACGSARLATEMLTGAAPSVDPRWFALDRRIGS